MADTPDDPEAKNETKLNINLAYLAPQSDPGQVKSPNQGQTPSETMRIVIALVAALIYPLVLLGLGIVCLSSAVAIIIWFTLDITVLIMSIARIRGPYKAACIILIVWSSLGLLVGGFVFMLILSCSGGLFH